MNLACFFCKQPGKSFNPQTKAYVRTKHSKICLTGTVTVNAMSVKLKMFVIGKLNLLAASKEFNTYIANIEIKKAG